MNTGIQQFSLENKQQIQLFKFQLKNKKLMAPMINESIKREVWPVETKLKTAASKKEVNKGAWTAKEDRILAEVIAIHGPKRWKSIAAKAGLNRCGKSCRLRWMNYLRPNIKRGNISDQEEDLILRLHKLLGNRWSLIAGRLPGRTDQEIKNYWNSHLSKKINQKEKQISEANSTREATKDEKNKRVVEKINAVAALREENTNTSSSGIDEESNDINGFDVNEFFDFSNENPLNLEWISRFLEPAA